MLCVAALSGVWLVFVRRVRVRLIVRLHLSMEVRLSSPLPYVHQGGYCGIAGLRLPMPTGDAD
jgi:hypothetical protein